MSETNYDGPVEFRNGIGDVRYQPTLHTGERLYLDYDTVQDEPVKRWIHPTDAPAKRPVLYRWRKAARVSAREARRRVQSDMSHWREVAPTFEETE